MARSRLPSRAGGSRYCDPSHPGAYVTASAHWSPDGRAIFFQSTGGASGRSSAPYSMNADGTGLRRLTSPRCCTYGSSLSPAGRSLVYERSRETGLGVARSEIFVASSDGSGARRLATSGSDASWSPDSRSVAYDHYVSGSSRVFVIPASGGTPRLITRGREPAWSPDGTEIAFERDDGVSRASRRRCRESLGTSGFQPFRHLRERTDVVTRRNADRVQCRRRASRCSQRRNRRPEPRARRGTPPGPRLQHDRVLRNLRPGTEIKLVSAAGGTPRELHGVRVPTGRPMGEASYTQRRAKPPRRSSPIRDCAYRERRLVPTGTHLDASGACAQRRRSSGCKERECHCDFQYGKAAARGCIQRFRIALLFIDRGLQPRVEVRKLNGSLLRTIAVRRPTDDEIFMSGRWLVYVTGTVIRVVEIETGKESLMVRARSTVVGAASTAGVLPGESSGKRSRIRALVLP